MPRVEASGLSYIQVDKHGMSILYHLHQCTDLAHHKIFPDKVCKGGILHLHLHYTTLLHISSTPMYVSVNTQDCYIVKYNVYIPH